MRRELLCLIGAAAVLLLPLPVPAQDHGGGGGGGGGCGDVFGDLIHILRHDVTGQPILQKRWVELPKEIPGYGWGYCPIAVDANGEELAFAPLSCDIAEEDLPRVVEVDYFGRLNGGRTKERNNRMHFNEVISSIKDAGQVKQVPSGRLVLGYDCEENPGRKIQCAEWGTIDSPMESLGLYSRLMRYGHFQTDPFEPDAWHHGDPKLPEQYHPALGPEDYAKFHTSVRHLLPNNGDGDPWGCFTDENGNQIWEPTEPYTDLGTEEEGPNGQYDEGEPFTDINANGERDDGEETFLCTDPGPNNDRQDVGRESLDSDDFTRAAAFLGAAANKTGKSTRDLVQYFGRIMKITKNTPHSYATLATLPALVRECTIEDGWVGDPDAEDQQEPPYTDVCFEPYEASPGLENYLDFPDVQERFVDFTLAQYVRSAWCQENVEVIEPVEESGDLFETTASLMDWLQYSNGDEAGHGNITAFVEAAGDTIRSIQFIHNYRIPEHLWDFTAVIEEPEEEE